MNKRPQRHGPNILIDIAPRLKYDERKIRVAMMRKLLLIFSLLLITMTAPAAAIADGVPFSGKYMVGADPVTGRNQQVDLSWEQLCLSTGYELQIAKDPDFTLSMNPAINSSASISAVTGSILLLMDDTNMTARLPGSRPAHCPRLAPSTGGGYAR